MNRTVENFLLFQFGWFSAVLGAAHGYPLAGLLAVALVVSLHLLRAPQPASEVRILGICALTGVVFDSLLLATGWISYPNGEWIPGLAPYWIVAMWVLFGTTLNVSMAWLQGRLILAVFAGAAGGPLSYLAGEKLGAIEFLEPEAALVALALGWGVILAGLAALARPVLKSARAA